MTTPYIPTEDLPGWMRQARRGTDWGVLLAIAFSVIAAWPFLMQPGLPQTNASENHVFRTTDIAASLQEGRLYPRWSPYAQYGYGAPIPHFYPPGSAYSAAVIQLLFTNDPVDAVRIVYIISLVGAGILSYVLVMRRAGSAAGLLTSILYVFSPFIGLTAPHIQGDLPLVISVMALPGLLWAIDRLLVLNRAGDLLLVALAMCVLLLTHPVMAAVGVAMAVAYAMWFSHHALKRLLIAAAGLTLGVLLAAFYWLPALLEQDMVRRWYAGQSPLDRIRLPFLFEPLQPIDPGALIQPAQFTLGPVLGAFMIVGLLSSLWVDRKMRMFHLFFAVAGVMVTVTMAILPEQVSLITPLTLCAAIISSGVTHTGGGLSERYRRFLLVMMLTVALATSLPTLLAPQWPSDFDKPSPIAQITYEQAGFGTAVLPPHAPEPSMFISEPQENRLLNAMVQADEVSRIVPGTITANMQASVLRYSAHEMRFQMRVNTPTTFNLLTTAFPGWQAELNGQPLLIRPNPETGLISIDLPSTFNRGLELVVWLGTTPIRQAGWALAGVALGTLLLLTRHRSGHKNTFYNALSMLSSAEARLISVLVIVFGMIVGLAVLPDAPVSIRQPSGSRLIGTTPLNSYSDTGLTLIAYQMDHRLYHPGDVVDLTLFWKSLRSQRDNVQVTVYLRGQASDNAVLKVDYHAPGYYPVRRWTPEYYVFDDYHLVLPHTLSSGEYFIMIEGSTCTPSCADGNALTFFDRVGQSTGSVLALPVAVRVG